MFNQIDKLASAIKNDVISGLKGYHTNLSISEELLCLDIIDERLQIIKEYSLKDVLPVKDLYLSINCIPVDCKDIERCRCSKNSGYSSTPTAHFEIPQIISDVKAIEYIGSVDRTTPFVYYTTTKAFKNHSYRRRGKNKPFVWIDTTPNENGMFDCFLFNAPFLKVVSITAIFKDPRLLDIYNCCNENLDDNMTFLNNEIKERLTKKKIYYYRYLSTPNMANDQSYT